jgi:hypothetical protein
MGRRRALDFREVRGIRCDMRPQRHIAHRALIVTVLLTVGPWLPFAPAFAAQPERPRAAVDTREVRPAGRTIAVAAGGNVQRALKAAQPGDVITLEAGATFRGPFTLPTKTGTDWIIVRTAAPDSSLPPSGTRVTPAHASVMPKLVARAGAGAVIQAAPGAHHFRFIGIELGPEPGAFVYNLMELGSGNATSEAMLPHDIIVDRCYLHGDPVRGSRRGIGLNGKSLAVIDSYLADFKEVGADSQAIMGWNGPGPFKIVNNYLEAAGENVMFGGADPAIHDLVPSDIEIHANHFFKPLSWRKGDPSYAGTQWSVKNLFELKNARRVLVDGNTLENIWQADQAGFAVQMTVRNQYGRAPWSTIEDVTFTRNLVLHAGSGINILGTDDPNPSQSMKRVLIQDNVFEDVSGARWGGHGRVFQILDYRAGTTDVVIDHNTAFQDGPILYAEGKPHAGFVFRNNLTSKGDYGVIGTGTGEGTATLRTYFPGAVFVKNVVIGGNSSAYPGDNFFPASLDGVGFVGHRAGNHRLAGGSSYKRAGTDKRDIGADIDALPASATAGRP